MRENDGIFKASERATLFTAREMLSVFSNVANDAREREGEERRVYNSPAQCCAHFIVCTYGVAMCGKYDG